MTVPSVRRPAADRLIQAKPAALSDDDKAWVFARWEKVLDSGMLSCGPNVQEFERSFAAAHGVRHAVAVSSGSAALEILLRIVGVAGREVIVPTNSFFATAAAVLRAGGRVRFVELDPGTLSLRLDALSAAMRDTTAAVVVMHTGGFLGNTLEGIRGICDERRVPLVEDAAHAHGSRLGDRPAGSFGLGGAFSMYATKVITSGEGGVITTDEDHVREEALVYRDQGKASSEQNLHVRMGSNWRMSECHAVLGLAYLRRLDEFIGRRQQIASCYDRALIGMDGVTPFLPPEGCRPNYYKYIAVLDGATPRDVLKRQLRDEWGVRLAGEVYEVPLHRQPVLRDPSATFPDAEHFCRHHICLPIGDSFSEEDAAAVVNALRGTLQSGSG
jgi:perosamine synthetase